MKSESDVPFHQSPFQSHSIQKQVGAVEMKFHLDFHTWYEHFTSVKYFQVKSEHQTVTGSFHIMSGFCYRLSQGSFVIRTKCYPVCMSRTSISCGVGVSGCPFRWEIHCIKPALRRQYGFSILSVAIQQVFCVSLVMIRVCLGTDQSPIQLQVNLFDDGVSQIVGNPELSAAAKLSLVLFCKRSSLVK